MILWALKATVTGPSFELCAFVGPLQRVPYEHCPVARIEILVRKTACTGVDRCMNDVKPTTTQPQLQAVIVNIALPVLEHCGPDASVGVCSHSRSMDTRHHLGFRHESVRRIRRSIAPLTRLRVATDSSGNLLVAR